MTIRITNGRVEFVYADELADLLQTGRATITRASHVEPVGDACGGWTADLSPVGGPVLGPFALRQQALDAEVAYLSAHLGRA